MSGLPYADAAARAAVLHWLEVFEGYVREVDYASAAPMFDPSVLAFGTHRDVIPDLAAWIRTQWNNVWPHTADFRFDLAGTSVLASAAGDMAVAVAPWTSTGFHRDGARFDRPGRASMVFRREGDAWICVHSHMSLNRGVPQESYAGRAVKAWPEGMG